jgi:hypothetical protein
LKTSMHRNDFFDKIKDRIHDLMKKQKIFSDDNKKNDQLARKKKIEDFDDEDPIMDIFASVMFWRFATEKEVIFDKNGGGQIQSDQEQYFQRMQEAARQFFSAAGGGGEDDEQEKKKREKDLTEFFRKFRKDTFAMKAVPEEIKVDSEPETAPHGSAEQQPEELEDPDQNQTYHDSEASDSEAPAPEDGDQHFFGGGEGVPGQQDSSSEDENGEDNVKETANLARYKEAQQKLSLGVQAKLAFTHHYLYPAFQETDDTTEVLLDAGVVEERKKSFDDVKANFSRSIKKICDENSQDSPEKTEERIRKLVNRKAKTALKKLIDILERKALDKPSNKNSQQKRAIQDLKRTLTEKHCSRSNDGGRKYKEVSFNQGKAASVSNASKKAFKDALNDIYSSFSKFFQNGSVSMGLPRQFFFAKA